MWQKVFPAEVKEKKLEQSSENNFKAHLHISFKPHINLATPNLCDFKGDLTEGKKFLEGKNPHVHDCRILAVEEPHTYFIDGNCENILSSTTFIHAFFPAFNGEESAKRMVNGRTFQSTVHRKSHKYHGCVSYQDVMKKWDEWRDLGTDLHDNIENFINDEEYTLHEDNKKAFQLFLEFYNDRAFWKWEHYRTEWAVFDKDTRIAGKIDYCGIDANGDIVILDWKRVGNISDSCFERFLRKPLVMGFGPCSELENCNYVTYSLQLNVYKWIIEKNYGMKVRKMFLVQCHPNIESPVIYKVPNLQSIIKNMVEARKSTMSN
jgi:hypothetical protein